LCFSHMSFPVWIVGVETISQLRYGPHEMIVECLLYSGS
jgi:hypothetical protein